MKRFFNSFASSSKRAMMFLLAAGLVLTSCYNKNDIPVVPDPPAPKGPATYTVTITVLDEAMVGVEGVTFQGITATGGKAGVYTFKPTSGGTYAFVASKTGYQSVSSSVVLPQGVDGDVITSSVAIVLGTEKPAPVPAKYNVYGSIVNGLDNSAITGATVICNLRGSSTPVNVTVSGNTFTPTITVAGVYDFKITHPDYENFMTAITIQAINPGETYNLAVTANMYKKGTVDGKTYTVKGVVKDVNGKIITLGGTVNYTVVESATKAAGDILTSGKVTITNGQYVITDLPKGQITMLFSVNGYNSFTVTQDISKISEGQIITFDAYLVVPSSSAGADVVVELPETGEVKEELKVDVPLSESVVNQEKEVVLNADGTPQTNPDGSFVTVPVDVVASLPVKAEAKILSSTIITDASGQPVQGAIAISSVTNGSIVSTSSLELVSASASTVSATFGPAGTQFSVPVEWVVSNPTREAATAPTAAPAFDKLDLEWLNASNVWVSQNQEVKYDKTTGTYVAKINHFSQYRLVAKADTKKDIVSTNNVKVYVTEVPVQNATYTYTNKSGLKQTTSVATALENAGITSKEVKSVIQKAHDGLVGKALYSEKEETQKTGSAMSINQALTATNTYVVTTYTLTFKVDGKDVVVVSESYTTKTNSKIDIKDPHHTSGDHVTDSGAGGGSGGNI